MDRDDAFDPADAAWAYVAGDLDAGQTAAFEAALAQDAGLRATVERLRARRAALAPPADMPAAPDLRGRIRAAVAATTPAAATAPPSPSVTAPTPLRFPATPAPAPAAPRRAQRFLAAAALVAIGVLVGAGGVLGAGRLWKPAPPDTVAWGEDGSPVLLPADAPMRGHQFLPVAMKYGEAGARLTAPPEHDGEAHPWFGVWIRPIDLAIEGLPATRGHLVVQVAADSPADAAGIRPGDIMLSLDDWPLETSLCIAHVLKDKQPGEPIVVRFWCCAANSVVDRRVPLGTRFD